MLRRVLERLAGISPRRHRELVRGMLTELDTIADPVERARFALGAIAAIARLALSAARGRAANASSRLGDLERPEADAIHGGSSMSKLAARELLLRHATPFAVALLSLTGLLLARQAARWVPQLSERGVPDAAIVEALVLTLPSTLALTIPMAVFLAVSWVFTRLGAEGALASVRSERSGVRRLVLPVVAVAAAVATLALVSNSVILPRANARVADVLAGAPRAPSDRTMTIAELWSAAERARAVSGTEAAAAVARYEVEIHKKLALPAACVILALAAVGFAIRFPRGGTRLALGTSCLVFVGYYLLLVAGEYLADRLVLSPAVAMWLANGLLLALALLLVRPSRPPGPADEAEALATL